MKPATIAYYTNKGFVIPDIKNPKGRGTTRHYSRRNLIEFLLINRLRQHGFALEKILEVLRQTKEVSPKKQFEKDTGRKPEETGINVYDGLEHFDDYEIQTVEAFIIIYDDCDKLKVEFHTKAKKKTKSELMELSSEDFKKERIRFQKFEIDMLDHDSAFVVNVSSLFQKVVSL
jgi:DNA-binding transcriptional MerR regulator